MAPESDRTEPWADPEQPLIWIVAGLPRSGTSMLMQMLEAADLPLFVDAHRPPDEDNPRGYFEHESVKGIARDASFLAAAVGHGVKVVAPLLRFLPPNYNYAVVFIERSVRAVLDSQRVMLERNAHASGPRGDSSPPDAALANAFERSLLEAKALLQDAPNFRALVVNHAETVASPRKTASAIADFLRAQGRPGERAANGDAEMRDRSALLDRMEAVIDPTLCRHADTDSGR